MADPNEVMQRYGLTPQSQPNPQTASAAGEVMKRYGLTAPPTLTQGDIQPFPGSLESLASPDVSQEAVKQLGSVMLGTEMPMAGAAQTGLEILSHYGITDPQLTESFTRLQMDLDQKITRGDPNMKPFEAVGEGISYLVPTAAAMKVPELIAKAFPKALRLAEYGVSAGTGAAIGGTQFQKTGEEEDRFTAALKGAGLGVAGEALTGPMVALGRKAIGSQIIKNYVKDWQSFANDFRANSGEVLQAFQQKFSVQQGALTRVTIARNNLGDREFPGVDTSSLVNDLQAMKSAGLNIGPEIKLLTQGPIKAGGKTLNPGDPLYEAVMKKGAVGTGISYSRIAEVAQRLSRKADSSPQVGQAAAAVDDFLDQMTLKGSKSLQDLSGEVTKRQEYMDSVTTKEFQKILKADTPEEANKLILDMATGDNVERAKTLYASISPEGRQKVREGIMYRALDGAMDKGKIVDPVKLSQFLDSPGIKQFFDTPRAKQQLEGMSGLLNEASQEAGQALSRTPQAFGKLANYSPALAPIMASYALLRGDVKTAAKEVAIGVGATIILRSMGRAIRTQRGQNFFAAASKVQPGSPESIRIFSRFMNAFGAVGGVAAGGEAGAGGKVPGALMEMGIEKGIESGLDALTGNNE